jgi:ABC-2 type transport system ATP-binding protein
MDAIRFQDVWRRHGDRWVVRGLDFRAPRGQVTALLGRNGAGKSTSIQMLMGFLAPHSGRVSVLGQDAAKLDGEARERIGYVPEDHPHFQGLRIAEVLDFEAGTRRRFDRALAEERLGAIGLERRARVGNLSRGMRAQLSIIVALACDPELLVLDDPGLGLDPIARREVLEAVIDTLAERGTSVLFTSHVLSDVERLADRVVVLHEGRAFLDASLDSLRSGVHHGFLTASGLDAAELAGRPGLLAARRRRGGFELYAKDRGALAELASFGPLEIGPCPGLEDLFLGLLSESRRSA